MGFYYQCGILMKQLQLKNVRVAVNGITEAVIEAYENCEPCYVETAIANTNRLSACIYRMVLLKCIDVTRPDFAGMEGRDGDGQFYVCA